MTDVPLNFLTASDATQLVRFGKATVLDIAKAHVERFRQRDVDVQAWAYLNEERILREAARLDEIPLGRRGPLHGVVLGVKDVIRACAHVPHTVKQAAHVQRPPICRPSTARRCMPGIDQVWTRRWSPCAEPLALWYTARL